MLALQYGGNERRGMVARPVSIQSAGTRLGRILRARGDLRLDRLPEDYWTLVAEPRSTNTRHFLFYFKDETFECDAADWDFREIPGGPDATANWQKVTMSSGSTVFLVPENDSPQTSPDITGPKSSRSRRWIATLRSIFR